MINESRFGGWCTLTLNHKGYSKSNRTQWVTKIYMYYKLGQVCFTNCGSFALSKIREKVVTNCGSHIITNWGNCYYEMGQSLRIRNIVITN